MKKLPSLKSSKRRDGNGWLYTYMFPSLQQARTEWDNAMGGKTNWEKEHD